jgi:hypothetical protein
MPLNKEKGRRELRRAEDQKNNVLLKRVFG